MDVSSQDSLDVKEEQVSGGRNFNYTGLLPVLILIVLVVARISYDCYRGQKTRNPQRRRMYAGSRQRPSLSQGEPTIYVSPSNLPPPPKYEALAPPSYEEVVGIHYPNYQTTQIQPQPITQPIVAAMAHASNTTENNANQMSDATVITVTAEERPPPPRVAAS